MKIRNLILMAAVCALVLPSLALAEKVPGYMDLEWVKIPA